ncbi:SGNH/GDSL hydrolase family protein [Vibrio vulnificus]|nr:SGNH/GDSL hydrolase family protein [Vibrio vulnificus]
MSKTIELGTEWELLSDLVPNSSPSDRFLGQVQSGLVKLKLSKQRPQNILDCYTFRASDSGGDGDEFFEGGNGIDSVYIVAYRCSRATCVVKSISSKHSTIGFDFSKYKNIVFLGASITEGAFGRDISRPNESATLELGIDGVNVYGYGVSGSTISSYIQGTNYLKQALDSFPSDTLFHIHLGGNNLSINRPWNQVDIATKESIISDYESMISIIGDRIVDCILSPISFRDYDGAAWGDENIGSLPFNHEVILPHQNSIFSNEDGYPVTDWYGFSLNNQALLHTDGVHFTPYGYESLRRNTLSRIRQFFLGVNPEPYSHTVPAMIHNHDGYMINFGVSKINNNGIYSEIQSLPTLQILRNDRDRSRSITWSASFNSETGLGVTSAGGKCGIDFNWTIQCDPFYQESIFVKSGTELTHKLSGFAHGDTVKIEIVGYRVSSADRITEIFEAGNESNISQINTSLLPPQEPAVLFITANSLGEVSFVQRAKSCSTFSYIGGMSITVV